MKTWLLFSVVLLAAGCAARKPIVDMKGVDEAQYQADLAECREYAKQAPGPGGGAAGGAIIGGAIGYGIGRAVGINDPSALGRGGAVAGGAKGAGSGARSPARGRFELPEGTRVQGPELRREPRGCGSQSTR